MANLPTMADFTYDSGTHTATWRFEGWALGDQYLLPLSDSVADVEGNRLDGEWINPASISTVNGSISTFPSGDGNAGGRFNFVMTLLPGDANLDGVVGSADWNILYANIGSGTDKLFTEADFDGDGVVGYDYMIITEFNNINLQDLWILADLDADGDVDSADLNLLNGNMGMSNPTWADGDFNDDGAIDEDDFDLAFAQLGLEIDWVA